MAKIRVDTKTSSTTSQVCDSQVTRLIHFKSKKMRV